MGHDPGENILMDDSSAVRDDSVVFLGDSITAAADWQSWFPGRSVHNLGVGGDTSDDVIARLDAVVALAPGLVALLIGTNDFGTRLSVEHLVRNIEYIMVSLRRELPGARLLVESIMPRGREFAAQIQDANRHLRQFAPGINAHFLDLWPALALDDGEIDPEFSDDRLHLTPAGYRAWLSELQPALERLEQAPPMSRPIGIIRAE